MSKVESLRDVKTTYVDLGSVYSFSGDVVVLKQFESRKLASKINLIGVDGKGDSWLDHPAVGVVCGLGDKWSGMELAIGDKVCVQGDARVVPFIHEGVGYTVINCYQIICKVK